MMQTDSPTGLRRVLYVAVSQGHLSVFHNPYLRWLRDQGARVEIAARAVPGFPLAEVDAFHDIAFARSPLSLANVSAFRKLVGILRGGRFDLVHCHTPVASVLTRLACLFAKGRPVVMYTAHGFHFFPGAPRSNWLLWFTLEWLLARVTDFVVTINHWDHAAARDRLRARHARLIPGVGVNLARFDEGLTPPARAALRADLGVPENAVAFLYIAEFIPRKNHAALVEAFAQVCAARPDAFLLLAGDGPLQDEIAALAARLGLSDRVRLLGFRRDIAALAAAADVAVSTSRQEGLPIGVAEAMAAGLPVIASEDRGHRELVAPGETGFLFAQGDVDMLATHAIALASDADARAAMGAAGRERVRAFGLDAALAAMVPIYREAAELARARSGGR